MNYPIFIYRDKEYTCIGHGISLRNGWEWYAFECTDKEEEIYFGYVMGFENEFGYFSVKELRECRVPFTTSMRALNEIMPPIGWTRKEEEEPCHSKS